MRRFLIEELKLRDYIVYQKPLKEEDIQAADEIFITNAIIGMKGVKAFRDRLYTSSVSAEIYNQVLAPIYL
jgi:branched-chain amino acid aminotransferase